MYILHATTKAPGKTWGICMNSVSFLLKTQGDLTEFTWFVRWAAVLMLIHPMRKLVDGLEVIKKSYNLILQGEDIFNTQCFRNPPHDEA